MLVVVAIFFSHMYAPQLFLVLFTGTGVLITIACIYGKFVDNFCHESDVTSLVSR